MHCYEVIPEKDACKLYFDLEFYKAANPGADGKDMVAKLIELVSQKLKELYDVNCSARDVLNLDSSTDEKFSRHLIFLPCKTVFKDNIHVGKCVLFSYTLEIKGKLLSLHSAISHSNTYFN